MGTSIGLSQAIISYVQDANPPEHPVLARCREETQGEMGARAQMQISPEQGAVMGVLARLVRAKSAVEIGVFTGYSSLAIALAMKEMHGSGARLFACDISLQYLARAEGYWKAAEVDGVIEAKAGPAGASLEALLAQGHRGRVDFAFVDADKSAYDLYYERCLELLRPGGLMLFDNVLWSGSVADSAKDDADTEALRAIAAKAKGDGRVHAALAAIGDGLLICLKK
ncbi:MAG: class I SAM-dependent methyltransferase [Alphaproteobacteria bacterium]|nr:class I SAM-dependent methyltransferase [Alphaproteobacteria bacterium]